MKKYNKHISVLLGILLIVNLPLKYAGRDYVFFVLLTALAVNITIKSLPNLRKNYTGEMVLKITRARIGWLLISIVVLFFMLELLSSRKHARYDYMSYLLCLFIISDAFVYYLNRRYNPILFAINGNELAYTINSHKTYDATTLIQVSKRFTLFERICILTFNDNSEIEFDERSHHKAELKQFLELLIKKSRFEVDVNPEIQQRFNLDVSTAGVRKRKPGIYGQFVDEPFDLADFDVISIRWRDAGMSYIDAVKIVMEKTGMLMGDARNAVEASAGWNR